MAASYPSSVKSFTTKATNDTIDAAHVNDLQAEVTAIEDALLNGIVHDLKFTDGLFDIGKSGATRPRDLFLSRDFAVGRNILSDLLFTDNTYDIGKTGATRPRDGFFSRNLTAGGSLDLSGAAAGQVVFPATQNASANANTLDDYEEGTWTPVLGGSGGTTGQAYSAQNGYYVKIGKLVLAFFTATLSTKGTITGTAQLQGLPFTIDNQTNGDVALVVGQWAGMTTALTWMGGYGLLNTTSAQLQCSTAAVAASTTFASGDMSNTTSIKGCIVYRASS